MRETVKHKLFIWLFISAAALYVTLSLTLPSDPQALERYQLSQTAAHLLGLTIVLPFVAIFGVAAYGFIKFRDYAQSIRESREGAAFNIIADGLMVLALSLPITACVSSILNYIAFTNSDLLPTATIVRNYISLAFPLATFLLIAEGMNRLTATVKAKVPHYQSYHLLLVIALTSIFTWLMTTMGNAADARSAYFLPNWLVIISVVIPYVFIWCKGIQAAYRLHIYQRHVKGTAYRHALRYLSHGVIAIIFLSIFIQLLTALSDRLNQLSLTPILIIIYALVVLYGVAYGLVAQGAKKLKQIEEV